MVKALLKHKQLPNKIRPSTPQIAVRETFQRVKQSHFQHTPQQDGRSPCCKALSRMHRFCQRYKTKYSAQNKKQNTAQTQRNTSTTQHTIKLLELTLSHAGNSLERGKDSCAVLVVSMPDQGRRPLQISSKFAVTVSILQIPLSVRTYFVTASPQTNVPMCPPLDLTCTEALPVILIVGTRKRDRIQVLAPPLPFSWVPVCPGQLPLFFGRAFPAASVGAALDVVTMGSCQILAAQLH